MQGQLSGPIVFAEMRDTKREALAKMMPYRIAPLFHNLGVAAAACKSCGVCWFRYRGASSKSSSRVR